MEINLDKNRQAENLVDYALRLGFSVSVVFEGEDDLTRSTNFEEISEAMYAYDEITLEFYRNLTVVCEDDCKTVISESEEYQGFAYIVINAGELGTEVSDYSGDCKWIDEWSDKYMASFNFYGEKHPVN